MRSPPHRLEMRRTLSEPGYGPDAVVDDSPHSQADDCWATQTSLRPPFLRHRGAPILPLSGAAEARPACLAPLTDNAAISHNGKAPATVDAVARARSFVAIDAFDQIGPSPNISHAASPESQSPRIPPSVPAIVAAPLDTAAPASDVAVAVAVEKPTEKQARINAFGPAPFTARLKAFWRLFRAHSDYAHALSSLWGARVGSGMLAGSFMVLISGMGTASPVQSVMTLATVDLLSHIIPPTVALHGAHLRDDADAAARVGLRTTPRTYAKGMLYTAGGDALIALGMFALAWRVAYYGLAGPFLLVPLGLLRIAQTCLSTYTFSLFNAFKSRLISPDVSVVGTNQHFTITSGGLRFVVLSMEANIGAMVFSLATASVVLVAESLLHSVMFHPVALTGIAIGGLLASLPKLVFYRHTKESKSP